MQEHAKNFCFHRLRVSFTLVCTIYRSGGVQIHRVRMNNLSETALVWLQRFPFYSSLNKDLPVWIDEKFNPTIDGAKIHYQFLHSVTKGKVWFGSNSYSSYLGIKGRTLHDREIKSRF